MKKNLKIKLLSKTFLLVIAILLVSCEKEQNEDLNLPKKTNLKIKTLSDLPKLKTIVENVKKIKPKFNIKGRNFSDFLNLENINIDEVVEYTDSTGFTTFTFKVINNEDTSVLFEYLQLTETNEGYIGYILSYEPDENWLISHAITQHGNLAIDVSNFEGHLTKYSLEREIIWTTHDEPDTTSRPGEFITECTISVGIICTWGVAEHNATTIEGLFNQNCTKIGTSATETCQTVWSSGGYTGTENGNENGSQGGGNTNDCSTTSGTLIINNQPLAGIGNACVYNQTYGLLPPIIETTCTENSFVNNYIVTALGINSFTQPELHNYIYNPENACEIGAMAIFINQNYGNQEAYDFALLGLEALNDGGEVDFEKQIIKDSSLPNCIKDIIDDLLADNTYLDLGDMDSSVLEQLNLAGYIMDIFNNSPNYNLIFKMDNLPPDSSGNLKNAQTIPTASPTIPGNFIITITLDTNYVTNATDLSLARTIIHESLHAYLAYITQENFTSTLALRLLSLSSSLPGGLNEAQHNEMSNNFVNAIANSLESWHNSALIDNNYYNYLSWSGSMLSTQAFLEKPLTFQTNCINANNAEGSAASSSTSSAQGTNSSNCP